MFGSEQFLIPARNVEYFTLQRAGARKILADAAQEKQEVKQGQWQQESPFQRGSGASQKKWGYRWRSPDSAPCVRPNEAWQSGEFLRMNAGKNESSVNGLLKAIKRLLRRWQWMISAA